MFSLCTTITISISFTLRLLADGQKITPKNHLTCIQNTCSHQHDTIDAFQEFKLRIGIAIGPVIAGVVGKSYVR